MNIWEIIEACATGGYVGGETFQNKLGQEIYFDGHTLKGLDGIDLKGAWSYVDTTYKAS